MEKTKIIAAFILIDSLCSDQDYISTLDGVVVKKENGEVFLKEEASKRGIYNFAQQMIGNYISKIETKIKENILSGDYCKEYEDCLPNCDVKFKYEFSHYEETTKSTNHDVPDDYEIIIEHFNFTTISVILENGEEIKIN